MRKNKKQKELNKIFYNNIKEMKGIDKKRKTHIDESIYFLSSFIGSINHDYQYNGTYLPSYIEPLTEFLEAINKKRDATEAYFEKFKKKDNLKKMIISNKESYLVEITIDEFWYYSSEDDEWTWTGTIKIDRIKSNSIFIECKITDDNAPMYSSAKISIYNKDNKSNKYNKLEEFITRAFEVILHEEARDRDEK